VLGGKQNKNPTLKACLPFHPPLACGRQEGGQAGVE